MPSKMFLVEDVCCPVGTVKALYDTKHTHEKERFQL